MKQHRKLLWVTVYKNKTRLHDWPTTTTTKWSTFCFALKNISSKTTRPISMKHHRKLLWMTVYKNTTRRHDWPTTKCLTSCFALKNISSETTRPNSMKHHRKLLWVIVYKNTTRRHDWPTTTTKCLDFLFCFKEHFLLNNISETNG